ncbi:MAG: chorismate synthase [Desulfuromonas sp.]|nr:chorismate synthase [Desulfuromonas sp.]
MTVGGVSYLELQRTATYAGEESTLAAKGRYDPCVVPRATPAAMGLADMALMQQARQG